MTRRDLFGAGGFFIGIINLLGNLFGIWPLGGWPGIVASVLLCIAGLLMFFWNRIGQISISFRNRIDQTGPGQIGPQFAVYSRHDENAVKVRELRRVSGSQHYEPHEKLPLSWATFTEGMEILKAQIDNISPTLRPQVVVGINYGGLIIASALAGGVFEQKPKLGLIRIGDYSERKIEQIYLPKADRDKHIGEVLVVDSELKTGTSLERAIYQVKDHYQQAKIRIALLVACFATITAAPPHNLHFPTKVQPQYYPHFVAFFTSGAIELPWKIK